MKDCNHATMMIRRKIENGIAAGLGCALSSCSCIKIKTDPLRAFHIKQLGIRFGLHTYYEVSFNHQLSTPMFLPSLCAKLESAAGQG